MKLFTCKKYDFRILEKYHEPSQSPLPSTQNAGGACCFTEDCRNSDRFMEWSRWFLNLLVKGKSLKFADGATRRYAIYHPDKLGSTASRFGL